MPDHPPGPAQTLGGQLQRQVERLPGGERRRLDCLFERAPGLGDQLGDRRRDLRRLEVGKARQVALIEQCVVVRARRRAGLRLAGPFRRFRPRARRPLGGVARVGSRGAGRGLGTGLAALRERLALVFGDEARLHVRSREPRGVVAEIDFPAREIDA